VLLFYLKEVFRIGDLEYKKNLKFSTKLTDGVVGNILLNLLNRGKQLLLYYLESFKEPDYCLALFNLF